MLKTRPKLFKIVCTDVAICTQCCVLTKLMKLPTYIDPDKKRFDLDRKLRNKILLAPRVKNNIGTVPYGLIWYIAKSGGGLSSY